MTRRTGIVASAAACLLISGISGTAVTGQDNRMSQIARVDFMATAKDGQPVTDLKIEDIVLRIDNKIRPIRTLNYVPMSEGLNSAALAVKAATTGGASAATPGPSVEIAPPFANNLVPPVSLARSIAVIVDDETMPIGEEQRMRRALTNFVRSLPEKDQVSIITVPHGRVEMPMTTDREKIAKAIADIQPVTPMSDAACRSRDTIGALQTTMNRLVAQRSNDQPVVVAFLSAALNGISIQEQAQRATIGGQGGVSSQAGACVIRADDFERIGKSQATARAQFYVINPDYSASSVAGGIEDLRSHTNAPLLHLTSSGEEGLLRMARETAGYYLATFDTAPDELVGTPHRSSIKTTRKDVEIRDRPFLIVGKDTALPNNSATRPDPALGAVTTAYDMIRSGRAFRDLPLRGTAWSTKNPKVPTAIDVIGVFEPIDPNTKIMQASAALFDENSAAQAYWPDMAAPMPVFTTWPTAVGLTVKPGNYRLRIAAIDDKGRTGVIDFPVAAGLQPAGPLQIGGLSLGVNKATGFTPRLMFTTEAAGIAMMELYGNITGDMKVSAVFEVARTTDGPAILRSNAAYSATAEEGRFVVMGTVSVASLPPGDYVVRGVVTVDGQGSGRVIRTLRKG